MRTLKLTSFRYSQLRRAKHDAIGLVKLATWVEWIEIELHY